MTLGTDTSDFQTLVSPTAYKASGRSFLIRKLGEGLSGPGDHVGADNAPSDIARLKAAGIDTAAYWFVHPSLDGAAQAQMAVGLARAAGVHGIACDCEVPDGKPWNQIAATMHAFLGTVKAAGFATLIYDNRTWVDTLGAEGWGVPIWYATPSVLIPDRGCVVWQCGQGSVPGISGTTDLDNWTGNQATYDLFFGSAPVHNSPPINYPGDNVQSIPISVAISGGHGWAASPVPAAKIVNVVALDENPQDVSRYDAIPTFQGIATQSSPNAANGALVFAGPSDGTFGFVVWAAS